MTNRKIIIFDGVCNFCNASVNFIIKRDPGGVFAFTPMQSALAKELITQFHDKDSELDTFLLIKAGNCYTRSDAALEICKDLNGAWPILRIFKIIPRPVRDFLYNAFARNRYKIFGMRDECMLPTPDLRNRFLE